MQKISPEQAAKIRDTQLSNALKRLKEGKPPTLAEIRIIDEATGHRQHGMTSTISQAAAKLKIPAEVIKIAKRAGCDAFRGSRIDCDKLKEWLDANDVKKLQWLGPIDEAKLKKLQAEADMKQLQLAIKRGEYVERDLVRRMQARRITTARSIMHGKGQGLAMILASMTGADPIMVEEKIRARDKEVIAAMYDPQNTLENVKCDHCGKETKIK